MCATIDFELHEFDMDFSKLLVNKNKFRELIFEELLFNPDKANNLDEAFEGTLFADVLGKKPFFFKNGKLVKGNFNVFLDTLNLGFWKGI